MNLLSTVTTKQPERMRTRSLKLSPKWRRDACPVACDTTARTGSIDIGSDEANEEPEAAPLDVAEDGGSGDA
jgi:hypothetical protein